MERSMREPAVSVIFTASNSLVGKIIRWITRGKSSHAMLQYFSAMWGIDWVIEASLPGVIQIPAKKARHNIVAEYLCLFDANAPLKAMADYVGEMYDFEGIFILGWILLMKRWFGKKIRHPLSGPKSQFCSELVARFFQAAKLDGADKWNPEMITPEFLMEYCDKNTRYFMKK
jgi:hypothetical protein